MTYLAEAYRRGYGNRYKDKNKAPELKMHYFKVKEDNKEIKILLLHGDRSDDVDFGISLFYFCTLSYTDLKYPSDQAIKNETKDVASAKFLFQNSDGTVYKCERDQNKANFYGKEISTPDNV